MGERETGTEKTTGLFIGIAADSNTRGCLVAITRPVRQSDASSPPLSPQLVVSTLAGSADAFTRLQLCASGLKCVYVRVMLVCVCNNLRMSRVGFINNRVTHYENIMCRGC